MCFALSKPSSHSAWLRLNPAGQITRVCREQAELGHKDDERTHEGGLYAFVPLGR